MIQHKVCNGVSSYNLASWCKEPNYPYETYEEYNG